jgi:hypothetical protein
LPSDRTKTALDQFDRNASVLNGFNRIGDLDRLAGGLPRATTWSSARASLIFSHSRLLGRAFRCAVIKGTASLIAIAPLSTHR